MPIDDIFVQHLSQVGYHPRSSKHSDFLSEIIITDLIDNCPSMRERAQRGELVVKLRHHQQVGHADWVIDIAFGTCAGIPVPPPPEKSITFTAPAIIQMAIELKSIFTEHGKARRNRLRDFNAFHAYAHQYNPQTVAGAFLAVNSSEFFYSPLREPNDITRHATSQAKARQLAKNTVDLFRSLYLKNAVNDAPGIEAIGVIVIEHDNLNLHPNPSQPTRRTIVAPCPPSLPIGDPMHYQSMIQRLCDHYTRRFA